jgi:hypothetical protein
MGVDQKNTSEQILSDLVIPHGTLCLKHHTNFGAITYLMPWSYAPRYFSFIFIIFIFLSIRQGCTRPYLSVAVKSFFYHLHDQGVVSLWRAFLHGN